MRKCFSGLILQVWGVNRTFPRNFKFGAATSAFQIEGAWNVSDKTPSIWDVFLHKNASLDNGDVTCDSYHKYQTDIDIAAKLGLDFYRFSISWTRLLPTGYPNHTSEDGKRYYNDVINGLLKKGIQPVVTLFHFDLPQTLQNLGGWLNPKIVDWFEGYARVVFQLFADRVKTFLTMNEQFSFCMDGYNLGTRPPSIKNPGVDDYKCIKNSLLAHAKAYRVYDKEFRSKYKGKISISNDILWIEGESPTDINTGELMSQFYTGLFSHPIYSKTGGWPPSAESLVASNSLKEGLRKSRLPEFTVQERKLVLGTYDFYGLNHYTCRTAREARSGEKASPGVGTAEVNAVLSVRDEWNRAGPSWFYVCPTRMSVLLQWLKRHYGDFEILITENGYGTDFGIEIRDRRRLIYMNEILKEILIAIHQHEVNVTGFMYWSIMDNLEFQYGFKSRFGMNQIIFTDPQLKRTPRQSMNYYRTVISRRSVNATVNDNY